MAARNKTAAAISRDDVLVLKTQFASHVENEEKWQQETSQKLDQLLTSFQTLQRHDQLLVGVTGDNGLNGDMKQVKARLDVQDKRWYKLFGAAAVVATAVGGLLKLIWK